LMLKSGCRAMSNNPPCPFCEIEGTPVISVSVLVEIIYRKTFPCFSVNRTSLLLINVKPHGAAMLLINTCSSNICGVWENAGLKHKGNVASMKKKLGMEISFNGGVYNKVKNENFLSFLKNQLI